MTSDYGTVSVLLPAYNAAEYIREALESVLSQTYRNLELLVVDDGSTDGTCRIVEEFVARDPRVRLFHQKNAGVGAARNTAIRNSCGTYIAPIDADDRWSPDKLEKQVSRIEELGPETGMVYCWTRIVDPKGGVVGVGPTHTVEGNVGAALLYRNIIGNASVPLFRHSALKKVGTYLSRAEQGGAQGFEDWDLSLRLAETFEVGVVSSYLVDYRQHEGSLSSNAKDMGRSFEVVIRRARQRNPTLPPRHFRWSRGNFYFYLTRRSYVWHDYAAFLQFLSKAVLVDPILLTNRHLYRMIAHYLVQVASRGRIRYRRGPAVSPQDIASDNAAAYSARKRPMGQIESRRWRAALGAQRSSIKISAAMLL